MIEMEHRVTVLESEVETLKTNRVEDRLILTAIQKDIHAISLTIAGGKGWIVGVVGLAVLLSNATEIAVKIFSLN
jgi:hypothetical protein